MARNNGNNFRKAMDELLNPAGKDSEIRMSEEPEAREEVEESIKSAPAEETRIDFSLRPEFSEPSAPREEAVIPSDMVITGSVRTKSDMKILGNIVGDVDCEGNIRLMGNIEGNVSAGNLTIQHGGLHGDAAVRETIVIEAESALKGNLEAQSIYSNARTEGQILAAGTVELKENAFVIGDISAGALSVSIGAKIKGMVDVREQ